MKAEPNKPKRGETIRCSAWLGCGVWHSIKESLPPIETPVLLWRASDDANDAGVWTGTEWQTGTHNMNNNPPTEWLMLPPHQVQGATPSNEHPSA